jgi:hypothetical protein
LVDRLGERLLDEDVLVGGERVGEHGSMREVRGRDDHSVDVRLGEQVAMVAVRRDSRLRLGPTRAAEAPFDAGVDRIGENDDLGALDMVEVEDVLAAHHPAGDDAVADGLADDADGSSARVQDHPVSAG